MSLPHHRNMGNLERRRLLTVLRRLGGQCSGAPMEVCDQSKLRVRAPISPPPFNNGYFVCMIRESCKEGVLIVLVAIAHQFTDFRRRGKIISISTLKVCP